MEYWSDDLDHRAAKDGIDDPGPIRGKNAMQKHIGDWIDTIDEFSARRAAPVQDQLVEGLPPRVRVGPSAYALHTIALLAYFA